MAVTDEVRIKIITDTKEAINGLAAWGAGIAAAIATVKKLADTLNEFVQAAYEDEKIETKLAAVLNATGNAAGYSKDQLLAMGQEIERTTVFSHDAANEAEALLLTYQNIGHDTFPRVMKAAADLSTIFGTDLKSSVTTLGVALENPVDGMNRLRRAGIVFTDEQKAMVKQLQESGDMIGAQNVILSALEDRVGGAATAMGDTAYGAAERLKNEMGELKDTLGAVIVAGIEPMVRHLATFVANVNDVIAAQRQLRELGGDISINPQKQLEELKAQLVLIDMQLASIDTKKGIFAQIGAGLANIFQLDNLGTSKEEIMRRQVQLIREILALEKEMAPNEEKITKEREAQLNLAAYLLKVEQDYAKTTEGKAEALRNEVAYWESVLPTAVATREQVEAILKYLREQLPIVESIGDALQRGATASAGLADPFGKLPPEMERAAVAAVSLDEAIANLPDAIAAANPHAKKLASLLAENMDYGKASTSTWTEMRDRIAMAAEDTNQAARKAEEYAAAINDANSGLSGMNRVLQSMGQGDFLGSLTAVLSMLGPEGMVAAGVIDIGATIIKQWLPGLAEALGLTNSLNDSQSLTADQLRDIADRQKIINQLMAEGGNLSTLEGTDIDAMVQAMQDAEDAATELGASFVDAMAGGITGGDWTSVTEAINEQMRKVILQSVIEATALQPLGEALANALNAYLNEGGAWGSVQAAMDALLSAGAAAQALYTTLTGNIPHLAAGGIATRPTMALIGEHGPEAVVPLNQSGGIGTTVHVYGSLIHERDLNSRIYAAVNRSY